MVALACNLGTREFKVILNFIVNVRPFLATGDPVSNTATKLPFSLEKPKSPSVPGTG